MPREYVNLCGRYGDYSPRCYLMMRNITTVGEEAITLSVVIDKEQEHTAPNPRYCGMSTGGKSLQTFAVFRSFFSLSDSLKNKNEVIFFESEELKGKGNSIRFFRSYDGDIVVCCQNQFEETFEEEICFPIVHIRYKDLLLLFAALTCDNAVEKTRAVIFD